MIGNTTYPSWCTAIDAEFYKYREWDDAASRKDIESYSVFDRFDIKFVASSRETYNLLYEEIMQMPLDFVIKLPPDLQSWVTQLRPELEGVRRDVGDGEKEKKASDKIPQTNVMLHEQKHNQAVLNLLDTYASQLRVSYELEDFVPRLDKDTLSEKEIEYLLYLKDIYPSLDSSIRSQIESESLVLAFPLEREPTFALLEAHYKGTKLWGDISRYKQAMGTYLSVGFKLHKTLMTQVYPLLLQGIEEAKLFLEGLRELVRVELAPVRVKLFSEGIQTGRSTILEELPDLSGKPLKQFLEFVNRYKNRVKDESKNNMQQAQDDGRVILELVDRLEKNYEIMKRLDKVILRGVEEEKLKGMLPAGIKCESCPSA